MYGPHGVQSWFGLIKMLRSFSYKNQQNILLKLKGKFVYYCSYYLGEYLATNEEVSESCKEAKDLNPRLGRII
jgi:hypothetical protein